MPRFAFNGGVSGIRRVPTTTAATGIWDLHQQNEAQRAGIWPQTGGDPNFANVSLLLHMDGSNGGTTFTDSSSNAFTVTTNGNAQISTAQSKFGGASGLFDGSGDYLTLADSSTWDMPGDFTVEAWMRPGSFAATPGGSNRALLSFTTNSIGNASPAVLFATDGKILFYGASTILTSTVALSVDTWAHMAFVRSGSTLTLYIDGTQRGTATYTTSITPNGLCIGCSTAGSGEYNGYIDELRITKGVARYTANFTPPTVAFPDY